MFRPALAPAALALAGLLLTACGATDPEPTAATTTKVVTAPSAPATTVAAPATTVAAAAPTAGAPETTVAGPATTDPGAPVTETGDAPAATQTPGRRSAPPTTGTDATPVPTAGRVDPAAREVVGFLSSPRRMYVDLQNDSGAFRYDTAPGATFAPVRRDGSSAADVDWQRVIDEGGPRSGIGAARMLVALTLDAQGRVTRIAEMLDS